MVIKYYIAWNESHKPRARIDTNYISLKEILDSQDFESYQFLEFPITQESLKPYDILVFACPDFSKIALQELDEIEKWVRQDGGGLLLLSHAGGDKGRNSNLSELAERFGIAFENDQVLSPHNYGMENLPRVSVFSPPHPITEGITEICYRAGCSLTSTGTSFPIAMSDENADPFSVPLIIISEADNGFVVAIGSYEMFRDEIGCGIENPDHKQLAINIFSFLISEYRKILKKAGDIAEPVQVGAIQEGQLPPAPIFGGLENVGAQHLASVSIQSEIKISSKSDIIQMLHSVLNEVNALKDVVENLIEAVVASEDEFIELKALQEMQSKVKKPPELDEEKAREPISEDEFKDLFELKGPPLKPLPPKPKSMSTKKTSEDEITPPPKKAASKKEKTKKAETKEKTPEEEGKKPPKLKMSKAELKAELEGLDSKLNSVKNLINFINKKKDDGKIKKKDYDSQMKKLKYDLENTNKRIEEVKKLLKKKIK